MIGLCMSKAHYALAALIAAALLISPYPFFEVQAAGALDPTFGNGGKVTTMVGATAAALDVAVQSDGKIVIGGASEAKILLIRYNSDGSLDNTFGVGGIATTNFPLSVTPQGIALLPNGKIALAAGHFDEISTCRLFLFNSDGSLDQSFGNGGVLISGNGFTTDVVAQSDGKIVVSSEFPNARASLSRYNSDGTLDPTFGSGGRASSEVSSGILYSLALQSNGKFVISGFTDQAGFLNRNAIVIRHNSNGSLDASFGSGGKVITDIGGRKNEGRRVAVAADGKIVVGGYAEDINGKFDLALSLYNNDGSLDTNFGSGGSRTLTLSDRTNIIAAVAIRQKILATGTGLGTFTLMRFNLDGSLDASFGPGGIVTTTFPNWPNASANSMTVQADGKIILAGLVNNGGSSAVALARYNSDSAGFDLCVRDDTSGNLLQLSSTAGDYLFTNCAGFTLGGTGVISKRGCIITLQANASDRRVLARIDTCAQSGTASVQLFSPPRMFAITDRNRAGNSCACTGN